MVESQSIIPCQTLERWQSIADILADLMQVPAALIMRLRGDWIEVLIASHTSGNPYAPGHSELVRNSGLYCERVINTEAPLLVNNALLDPEWMNNPDVKLHMISYLGFPIFWPDRVPFGTICVLDNQANRYNVVYKRVIAQFRDVLEEHLKTIRSAPRYHESSQATPKIRERDMSALRECFRMLGEHATDGFVLHDEAGRILDISEQACQLIGLSGQKLRDSCVSDLPIRLGNLWNRSVWKGAKAGQVTTIPSSYVTDIGQSEQMNISFSCEVTGKHKVFLGIFHDVRERPNADRVTRERHDNVMDDGRINVVGTWSWDIGQGEFVGSEEWVRILGIEQYGSPLSYDSFIALIHPDDRRRVAGELQRAVSARGSFQIEIRMLRTGNPDYVVQVAGRPAVSEKGQTRFSGTLIDVTERIRAQRLLCATRAALASASRSSAIEELAGSVVHEINQPLGVIANYAGTMRRWLDQAEPDLQEVRNAASGLIEAAVKAGEIASGLKAIARTPSVTMSSIDLDAAIGEVLDLAKHDVELHGVVLRTNLRVRGRSVRADKARVQQVMLNLVSRALSATTFVSGRTRTLRISSKHVSGDFVRVTVEDNGRPLDNEDFACLFDPLPIARTDDMGMGLSACRSIIEAHGGRVWGEPGFPDGTILCFELRRHNSEDWTTLGGFS